MRRTRALAVIAGLTLSLGACGGGSDTSTGSSGSADQPSAPASSGAEGGTGGGAANGTITVWADATRAVPLKDIAKTFESDKGVSVKIVQKDFSKERDDFISQAPTGNGPDVVVGANDWIGKMVQNGVVAPLELGDKAADFPDIALQAMTYNGKIYGLPYAVENIGLVRNTKLAPKAPKDFEEAMAMGRQLVSQGKAKYPILLGLDPKSGDPYHLYPWETSFGSFVFELKSDGSYDASKMTLGDANGLQWAGELAKLGQEKVLNPSISGEIATSLFAKGKAPFYITGPWNTPDFQKAKLKLAVDPVPPIGNKPARPFVGVQGFFVSSKSKNQLLANDFVLNYLSNEDVQLALYKAAGRPPALKSALDKVSSDPIIAGFGKVGQNGLPLPNIPAMDSVWADWGTTELAIIQGKGDPQALWKKMAKSIESKIAAG